MGILSLPLGKDETSGRGLDSSTGGFDWTLHWRKEWFSRRLITRGKNRLHSFPLMMLADGNLLFERMLKR